MLLEISLGVFVVLCIIQSIVLMIIYHNYKQIEKYRVDQLDIRENKIKEQEDYIQKLEKCEQIQQNIKMLLG